MAYKKPVRYTKQELQAAWIDDLLADAEHSEKQAEEGPFFPEKGITRESLLAYAAKCRQQAADNDPAPTFTA
jgi:hypothetical protein